MNKWLLLNPFDLKSLTDTSNWKHVNYVYTEIFVISDAGVKSVGWCSSVIPTSLHL